MTKNINIYFLQPTIVTPVLATYSREHSDSQVFINPAPLYLDSYLALQDPLLHQHIEWKKIQLENITQAQLLEDLEYNNINILCVSVYIWNCKSTLDILKGIKQKLSRDITIIVGGPSVTVARNQHFLTENPDIDYFIYAQGENPFLTILQHLVFGKKINPLTIKNCAWRDKATGKFKIADYEFLKIHHSPYLISQNLLKKLLLEYLKLFEINQLVLVWETTRGCPYNCSFCDWTSGLGNKVSKRDNVYSQELELFASLNLFILTLADANFGIYNQDIEIVDCLINFKKIKGYPFSLTGINWSKTKKNIVFDQIKKLMAADIIIYPKISIQDIHEHVLKNIDRPDITWAETVEYINDIREKFPDRHVVIELIQGLPGQTRESWEQTLTQCLNLKYAHLYTHQWILIPNSPADYDKEYAARMQLQTLSKLSNNYNSDPVVSTFSYNIYDYAYMSMLGYISQELLKSDSFDLCSLFPIFAQELKKHADLDQLLSNLVNELGHRINLRLLMRQIYIDLSRKIVTQVFSKELQRKLIATTKIAISK